MTSRKELTAALLSMAALAILIGWILAHNTVATECEKLGSFYVGDKVFKCELKEVKQ